MKYSIEVNHDTVTEQLEYNGREYKKTWHADANRIRTKDPRFCDQLEDAGIADERVLDNIYEVLDSSGIAISFLEMNRLEAGE